MFFRHKRLLYILLEDSREHHDVGKRVVGGFSGSILAGMVYTVCIKFRWWLNKVHVGETDTVILSGLFYIVF